MATSLWIDLENASATDLDVVAVVDPPFVTDRRPDETSGFVEAFSNFS
ncbi:MAG: hypothetical protein AAF919_13760 [Pseudomonadota bacterium]